MLITVFSEPKSYSLKVTPDYLHFTRKCNLEFIEKNPILGMFPEGYTPGCALSCNKTYGYNLDLIKKFKDFRSLPLDILKNPNNWCCLYFVSDPNLWWHYEHECCAQYSIELEENFKIPLRDYLVLSVEEALNLIEVSLDFVKNQRRKQ